jgi:hypothetical protein
MQKVKLQISWEQSKRKLFLNFEQVFPQSWHDSVSPLCSRRRPRQYSETFPLRFNRGSGRLWYIELDKLKLFNSLDLDLRDRDLWIPSKKFTNPPNEPILFFKYEWIASQGLVTVYPERSVDSRNIHKVFLISETMYFSPWLWENLVSQILWHNIQIYRPS